MKPLTFKEVLETLAGQKPGEYRNELARLADRELTELEKAGSKAPATAADWIAEATAVGLRLKKQPEAEDLSSIHMVPVPLPTDKHQEARDRGLIWDLLTFLESSPVSPPSRTAPGPHFDLARIRYPGDAADIEELRADHRLDQIIATCWREHSRREAHARSRRLATGMRLTAHVSPRIHAIIEEVASRLGLTPAHEVICLPGTDINASPHVHRTETGVERVTVTLTAGALERLEDAEIAFLLGHEAGHYLFGHDRLNAVVSPDPAAGSLTVLSPAGESLFLRWRKKAEISADRIGLIACRDFRAATRVLLKAAFGLSDRNITPDIDALMLQLNELEGHQSLAEADFASHPLLPLRLKALELFSRSDKAAAAGCPVAVEPLSDEALCVAVDGLVQMTRRHPAPGLERAAMDVVACGGVLVLGADGEIGDREVKILIDILHHYFTDEPQAALPSSPEDVERILATGVDVIVGANNVGLINFVLGRLAEIALADGSLLGKEGAVILGIGERLGFDSAATYQIMVAAAEQAGVQAHTRFNRAALALRRSLGMTPCG